MKLESAASIGRDRLRLQPKINEDVINTTNLVHEIFTQRNAFSKGDLASAAQSYIARGLAQLASEKAAQLDIDIIGFSGGVAYNEYIASTIRRVVVENGLRFAVHELVPPGDGGISFGQVVAASWQMEAE